MTNPIGFTRRLKRQAGKLRPFISTSGGICLGAAARGKGRVMSNVRFETVKWRALRIAAALSMFLAVLAGCQSEGRESPAPQIALRHQSLDGTLVTDNGIGCYGPYVHTNNQGDMTAQTSSNHIAVLRRNGHYTNLGVMGTDTQSRALDMNEAGDIIVDSYPSGVHFLWKNGVKTALPGVARAINNVGQIVGWMDVVLPPNNIVVKRAYLRQIDGTIVHLTTSPANSYAWDINDAGMVVLGVGGSQPTSDTNTFHYWQSGALTSLGVLQSAYHVAMPTIRVNNKGQIAGVAKTSGTGGAPFFWENGAFLSMASAPYMTGMFFLELNEHGQAIWGRSVGGFDPWAYYKGLWLHLNASAVGNWSLTSLNERGIFSGCDGSSLAVIFKENRLRLDSDAFAESKPGASDPTAKRCGTFGMCKPQIHAPSLTLELTDTPIGYETAVGPDVFVSFSYTYDEHGRAEWRSNLTSYLVQDSSDPVKFLGRYPEGGGYISYANGSYNAATGMYSPEPGTGAVLKRIPATGTVTSYELTFPDGMVHVFGQIDTWSSYETRARITAIRDPSGHSITFQYHPSFYNPRGITDSLGRQTVFETFNHFESIRDPFGRRAIIVYCGQEYPYDWISENEPGCPNTYGMIKAIIDVDGITSRFTYDYTLNTYSTDMYFINTLTTPYGSTAFTRDGDSSTSARWLEITDPIGWTERIERRSGAPGVVSNGQTAPSGMTVPNGELDINNTFYWDKYAYSQVAHPPSSSADYGKAVMTHWLKDAAGAASGSKGAEKKPLEGYVFYNYPGQPDAFTVGTSGKPSKVGPRAARRRVAGDELCL